MDSPINTIVHGDIVKVLPALRSNGILFDVIIADPPYNIGKDFGNNKDDMSLAKHIIWAKQWIALCRNLLTDKGILYIYGMPEIVARMSIHYPVNEQRWLVWHYTNKTSPSSDFWQRSHETILCLWKRGERRPRLEVDQIREPYTAQYSNMVGRERKGTPSRYGKRGLTTTYGAHENGALPRDVIKVPALAGGSGRAERWFICRSCDTTVLPPDTLKEHRHHDILKHPTQKPMKLTRRLILSRIDKSGGRLLVPFAGSGSECVVAQELNIDFVGIEINPDFVSFGTKWLEATRGV